MKRILIVLAAVLLLAAPAAAQSSLSELLARENFDGSKVTQPDELAPNDTVDVPVTAPRRVTLPFEDLQIYDELPDYVYSMPRAVYVKWAKMQNAGAYRKAQRMADAFVARNPLNTTYVQDSDYTANVTQEQHEEVSPTTADFSGRQSTRYNGKNRQFTFQDRRYGGGPVLLLNPYMPSPPKVIFLDDGTPVIADPDNQVRTKRQAKKLLREATK